MKQADDTLSMDLQLPQPQPAWRVALNAAIAGDPAGKKGVADRMTAAGYTTSRPYVSRVTSGDLQHRVPAKFIARVVAVLMQVDCPHLQRPLPPAECAGYAARSYAQISSFEVDHWRACRSCPNNAGRRAELAAALRAQAGNQAQTASGTATAPATGTAIAPATPAPAAAAHGATA